MSIRTFGHWICLLAIVGTGAAAVASCGNSPTSVFSGLDGSLDQSALPPAAPADAGPPVDLDAFSGCVPKKCSDLGYNCGMNGDGCGGLLDCGACPSGQFCGGFGYSLCGTGLRD